MALWKAIKVEVLILAEGELTDEDVTEVVHDAMIHYCSFREVVVKIVESHQNLIMNPDAEA